MKKVMRPRYYCDHCGKGGGSAYHIQRHEKGCTMNPLRVCGMCRAIEGGSIEQPMEDLITALLCHGDDYEKGLLVLREVTDNCPACILAAIRQSKIQRPPMLLSEDGAGYEEWDDGVYLSFDFKKEKEAFWDGINTDRAEREDYH